MSMMHNVVYAAGGLGLVGYGSWALLNSNVGYPYQLWWTDMMDSQAVKAYERPMMDLPAGVVPHDGGTLDGNRMTPEGQALTNPYEADEEHLAQGEWAFNVYCVPCHSVTGEGGGEVVQNKPAEGKRRFQVPALNIQQMAPLRTDGYLFLTIKNGGAIMPGHGWAMTDEEMWSIVSYIRNGL